MMRSDGKWLGRRGARLVALLAAVAAATLVYYTQIQPGRFAWVDPIEIVLPEEPGPHRIFVYGTLRSATVRFIITGRMRSTEAATLPDYRRVGRNILPDPQSSVEGYVIDVTTSELRRLDRYERTGPRYERVEVTLADGSPAWAYRMLPRPEAPFEGD